MKTNTSINTLSSTDFYPEAVLPPFSPEALERFAGVLAATIIVRRSGTTVPVSTPITLTRSSTTSGVLEYQVGIGSTANQGADLLIAAYSSSGVLIGYQVVNRASNLSNTTYNGSFNFAAAGVNSVELAGVTFRAYQGTAGTSYGSGNNTTPTVTYRNSPTNLSGSSNGFRVNSTSAPTSTVGTVDLATPLTTTPSGYAQAAFNEVTIDTVAPTTTATITAINDNVGFYQGVVASGGRTDDTSLNLSGSLSAALADGESVVIFSGTSLLGTATVTGTTWSFDDTRILINNQAVSYTASVRRDVSGNLSTASAAYTATVDTLIPNKPTLAYGTGVSGGNGATLAEATQTTGVVRVTAEAASTVTVTFTSTAGSVITKTLTGTGSSQAVVLTSADVTTLGDRTVSVTATARDVAGNLSQTSSAISFVIDTVATAPVINSVGGSDNTVTTAANDNKVVGVGQGSRAVTIRFGESVLGTTSAASNGAFTYILTAANLTTIGDGTGKQITASQTDGAGNTGTSPAFTFSVNSGAVPVVSSVALTAAIGAINNWLNAGDFVEATVTMSTPVTVTGAPQLKLNINGTLVDATYNRGSGTNSLVFKYEILSGENDTNGISINANSLGLNGGTIGHFEIYEICQPLITIKNAFRHRRSRS